MTLTEPEHDWTPDEVEAVLKRLAQDVLELGRVDWGGLIQKDEAPSTACTRVSTLVNAAGMLGSLAMAAQVPVEDFFTGMVAAALESASAQSGGANE